MISASSLPTYESAGWEGMVKKNGDCLIVWGTGEKTRHRKGVRRRYDLDSLRIGGCTLACEGMEDGRVFVWDVLRFNDRVLKGTTFAKRRVLLHSLGLPNVLVVRTTGLLEWYESLEGEDEGLVIRRPKGRWGAKGWILKVKR